MGESFSDRLRDQGWSKKYPQEALCSKKSSSVSAVVSNIFASQKRKDRPANRRPFLSRENSSNGGKAIRTFWTKSYGRAQGVSSEFSDTNALKINDLRKLFPASKMWQLLAHFFHCS